MGENRTLIVLDDITLEREKQEKLYLADRLATVGEMASVLRMSSISFDQRNRAIQNAALTRTCLPKFMKM